MQDVDSTPGISDSKALFVAPRQCLRYFEMPPFAKRVHPWHYPCFTRTPKFHCGFGDNEQLINCVKPQSVSKEQVLNAESLLCFAEIILYPPCPHILASQLGLEKNNSSGAGYQSQRDRNRFSFPKSFPASHSKPRCLPIFMNHTQEHS